MICLTSARLSMTADLLHWTGITTPSSTDVGVGTWGTYQDPITGEIRNDWEPATTPDPEGGSPIVIKIKCQARGVISQGVYASGSGERFGANYDNFEVVRLWVPGNFDISKRDRVTNITDSRGNIVFKDPENASAATIYNVQGVTPIFDGFNRLIQNYVLIERAPAI